MDFLLGSWLVQPELNALVRDRETRQVTPKSMDLLVCLARREGRVVSKDEIHQELWPDTFVTDDALTRCIVELRRALGESARDPETIGTVSRRGYRVLVPVTWKPSIPRARAEAPAAAATPVPPAAVEAPPTARPGSWRRGIVLAGAGLLAALVALAGTRLVRGRLPAPAGPPVVRSVAVLPLADLSGDPAQEYFADGMTEELIAELAHIEAWKVISRTSSMRYKRSTETLPEIARKLGVDAVVEGTVLRSGGRVRITAQLIRAATDTHLWSGSFERETTDVMTLQREIAQAIAADFRIQFSPRPRIGDPPAEPAAYEAYLHGWYFLDRREFSKAASYFEEATVRDPQFALAHALLFEADAMDTFVRDLPLSPRALRAMERARSLDDTLAEVHDAAGDVAFFAQWNWAAGEAEYRRAVQLDPRSVDAARHHASCLHALTRWDEAIREYRRALELDPASFGLNLELLGLLINAHRYPEAVAQLHRTLELDPDRSAVHQSAGTLYEAMGKDAEAAAAYLDAEKRAGRDAGQIAALEAGVAARGLPGYWEAVLKLIQEAATGRALPPFERARVYVRAGQRSEALALLEAAFARHDVHLAWIKAGASWDPLRSDPRFQALLRRMNFPD